MAMVVDAGKAERFFMNAILGAADGFVNTAL
jgi:hypothetical protein